ncbi:hypothetical protein MTO96_014290 [Rhipicephalus appendiculatus]
MVSRKSFRSWGGLLEAGRSFNASSTQQLDDAVAKFFMVSQAFSRTGAQPTARRFSASLRFAPNSCPLGRKFGASLFESASVSEGAIASVGGASCMTDAKVRDRSGPTTVNRFSATFFPRHRAEAPKTSAASTAHSVHFFFFPPSPEAGERRRRTSAVCRPCQASHARSNDRLDSTANVRRD